MPPVPNVGPRTLVVPVFADDVVAVAVNAAMIAAAATSEVALIPPTAACTADAAELIGPWLWLP